MPRLRQAATRSQYVLETVGDRRRGVYEGLSTAIDPTLNGQFQIAAIGGESSAAERLHDVE